MTTVMFCTTKCFPTRYYNIPLLYNIVFSTLFFLRNATAYEHDLENGDPPKSLATPVDGLIT
jgi:hypothetical protein